MTEKRIPQSIATKSLEGITVLDLTRVLAGPFATMLLGDAGANVIKIEPPAGDETRQWGPPWVGEESAYFLSVNRNKRSISLDLSGSEGRRILLKMAEQADVIVENYKVQTMERWGLGYEEVIRPLNPGLIYANITGFGRSGPYAHLPGYDTIVEAMGGLMGITGDPQGEPMKVGVAIVDVVTGCLAAYAVSTALVQRFQSGKGQRVDLSLLDACLAGLVNQAQNYLVSGEAPRREGNAHPNIVPYQTFSTADGYLMLAVGNNRQFKRLCDVLGLSELAEDSRFKTNPQRVSNRNELISLLARVFQKRTAAEWTTLCRKGGVPAAPVRNLKEVFEDPHVQSRSLTSVEHPTAGLLSLVASPVRFEGRPASHAKPPPRLGEHSVEVLKEAGFTMDEIESWLEEGIVRKT